MHHKHAEVRYFNIYYNQIIDPRLIADKGAEITIGDLHANSRKLIAALVKHRILKLSVEEQLLLSHIYLTNLNQLTKEMYDRYCLIIATAPIHPEAREAFIRLIGDETGDRGVADPTLSPYSKN